MRIECTKCVRILLWGSFVFSSVFQSVAFAFCVKSFDSEYEISLILFVTNIFLLITFGIPVIWVHFTCGGFLPEMRSRVLRKSLFFIGFCNAVAKASQSVSYTRTPLTLQASLSHTTIPFVIAIVISSNLILKNIFSKKALTGSGFIVLGALMHLSTTYLHSGNTGFDMLWWNVMFLMSHMSYALSAVYQQRCYAIRRVNVFYMLFCTNFTQLIFFGFFLPLSFIRDDPIAIRERLSSSFSQFYACIFNIGNKWTEKPTCSNAGIALCLLFLFTFSSQVLQICLVRRASYRSTSLAILAIPTILFSIFSYFSHVLKIFIFYSSDFSSIILEAFCYGMTLYGGYVYRLDSRNGLSKEYIFPADPFFQLRSREFRLYAAFLSSTNRHGQLQDYSFSAGHSPLPYSRSVRTLSRGAKRHLPLNGHNCATNKLALSQNCRNDGLAFPTNKLCMNDVHSHSLANYNEDYDDSVMPPSFASSASPSAGGLEERSTENTAARRRETNSSREDAKDSEFGGHKNFSNYCIMDNKFKNAVNATSEEKNQVHNLSEEKNEDLTVGIVHDQNSDKCALCKNVNNRNNGRPKRPHNDPSLSSSAYPVTLPVPHMFHNGAVGRVNTPRHSVTDIRRQDETSNNGGSMTLHALSNEPSSSAPCVSSSEQNSASITQDNRAANESGVGACPFYLPSPLPHAASLPAVVRPVLMNVWSGNILCEYTDYKRNYDSSLSPTLKNMAMCEEDEDPESPLFLPWRRDWSALKQYTKSYMDCIGDTEEAIRKLYAYHRMGTLAASMAAQWPCDEVSTPSSRTSNISWCAGSVDMDLSSLNQTTGD